MKLHDELKEQETLYANLEKDLREHFPKGSHLSRREVTEYTSMTTRLMHIDDRIHRLREAIYDYSPHDDYWEVIEHCIDHDITPEFLMEIITIWRSLP